MNRLSARIVAFCCYVAGIVSGVLLAFLVLLLLAPLSLTIGPLSLRTVSNDHHSIWVSNSTGNQLVLRAYGPAGSSQYLIPDTSQRDNSATATIPEGNWVAYDIELASDCSAVVAAGQIGRSVSVVYVAVGKSSVWSTVDPAKAPDNRVPAVPTTMCALPR